MSRVGVTFHGDWKAMRRIFDFYPLEGRMERAIGLATKASARLVQHAIQQNIRKGTYAVNRVRNAKLTRELKHGRRPLVEAGDMWKAVDTHIESATYAEVGIPKGHPVAWYAIVVHDGENIPVTPAMRGMFQALAIASRDGGSVIGPGGLTGRAAELFAKKPGGWKPLKDTTTVIRIPPRPFVDEVAQNARIRELVARNWLTAAALAICDLPINLSQFKQRA